MFSFPIQNSVAYSACTCHTIIRLIMAIPVLFCLENVLNTSISFENISIFEQLSFAKSVLNISTRYLPSIWKQNRRKFAIEIDSNAYKISMLPLNYNKILWLWLLYDWHFWEFIPNNLIQSLQNSITWLKIRWMGMNPCPK